MHAHWQMLSLVFMFEKIVVGYAGDQAGRDVVTLAARLAGVLGSQPSSCLAREHMVRCAMYCWEASRLV